jgi:hypothetical protein
VLYAKPYFTLDGDTLSLHGVPPPKRPLQPENVPEADRGFIFSMGGQHKGLKARLHGMKQDPRFDRLVVRSGLMDLAMKWLHYQPIKDYGDANNPAWRVMQALIGQWIREHPKPVALMPIPLHHHVYGISSPRDYQRRLRAATEAAGGSYVEALPALMAAPQATRRGYYFANDHHLTRAGHAALAEAAAPSIAALLAQ